MSELKMPTVKMRNSIVRKILYDGYGFLRSKEKRNSTYWVCDQAKAQLCRAKLTTFADSETYKVTSNVHTHGRNGR
jgi:FLYWCH zinc finger domain